MPCARKFVFCITTVLNSLSWCSVPKSASHFLKGSHSNKENQGIFPCSFICLAFLTSKLSDACVLRLIFRLKQWGPASSNVHLQQRHTFKNILVDASSCKPNLPRAYTKAFRCALAVARCRRWTEIHCVPRLARFRR